jgi:hypothetical protein
MPHDAAALAVMLIAIVFAVIAAITKQRDD